MKNILLTAFTALLGLAFASLPATAQTSATSTTPVPAAATKPETTTAATSPAKEKKTPYVGTITAVTGQSITVKTAKTDLTLGITATTKFKKNAPAISDFAVGDKVTGSYSTDASGATVACSVHKKSTTTAKATPSTAAPSPATPASTN